MKATFQLESETGGFMLIDPAIIPNLDGNFVEQLNVLFDPDGQTCAIVDYPEQDWSVVWQNAVNYFQLCEAHRQILVALACEGTLFVRVQDRPLSSEEVSHVLERFLGEIQVSGKQLAVIDGMTLFDEGEIAKREMVSLPNGFYPFTVYHLRRHQTLANAVGIFGDKRWPTIIIVLNSSADAKMVVGDNPANLIQLDTRQWITELREGVLCAATVTKIEQEVAFLHFHLTQSTRSGYGRMAIPRGKRIKPNQDVVVRLGLNQGAYWQAEFIDA